MSILAVYSAPGASPRVVRDADTIAATLQEIGVLFERWEANRPIDASTDEAGVLAAYQGSVERLQQRFGFRSADVISLTADHPQKDALRSKFLAEHTHAEFEVRFFVSGQGLFCIHSNDRVYMVLCTQGDLISVPENTTHWFDMGAEPGFQCIRLFTTTDGWVANFTGSDIARHYPNLDEFVQAFESAAA
jgi:1,2-dihydroxy-3-keto-5-methylthiopentene dioxygenase